MLDARPPAGKGPLWCINPELHEWGAQDLPLFMAVPTGDNHCTAVMGRPPKPVCCPEGFRIAPETGWSPVVGRGIPNFLDPEARLRGPSMRARLAAGGDSAWGSGTNLFKGEMKGTPRWPERTLGADPPECP